MVAPCPQINSLFRSFITDPSEDNTNKISECFAANVCLTHQNTNVIGKEKVLTHLTQILSRRKELLRERETTENGEFHTLYRLSPKGRDLLVCSESLKFAMEGNKIVVERIRMIQKPITEE